MGAEMSLPLTPGPAPGPAPEPLEEAQSWLKKLGNLEGFAKLVLYYAVALIAIGYIGATTINICNMTGEEIDYLFPSNLQSYPYMVPANESNPPSNTIADIFKEFHANQDAESLTRATLEVVYPCGGKGSPTRVGSCPQSSKEIRAIRSRNGSHRRARGRFVRGERSTKN
jgi:hypothetical protein